ncbi:MAG: FAD/NAD(P)-binding oxidoreductase [Chloroflexota bacterium]
MKSKTILILGGGVGGIVTANALRKKLSAEHRVIVAERNPEHVFNPSLLWVMVGLRQPQQITKKLERMLNHGVELVQAEVQAIDPDGGRVETSHSHLDYDYLVIALGASLAPEDMPGFKEAAYTPYDLEGATGLWNALQTFEGGRIAVLVSSMPYKCPAAPYETALLLDDYLRRRGIRERSQVEVYTSETLPMGVAGPAMGKAVVGMLEARDIRFYPELKPTGIDPERKELIFDDNQKVRFNLLAGVPPHKAPRATKESPFSNEAGWIPVNKHTLQTGYENIYTIGDVATIALTNGKALPKAGVFADGQAHTVARRIAEDIKGIGSQAEFDGLGFCWIETGNGSAGFASGEFYAEPDPIVPLPRSGRLWHWGKILFEKYWLGDGLSRNVSRFGLKLGDKALGIPVTIQE